MRAEKQDLILGLFKAGKYYCCADGFVYSRANKHGGLSVAGRRLISKPAKNGYHVLSIYGDRPIWTSVHSLIALYFFGKFEPHLQINHKNGVKVDNRATNLELVTSSDNHKHAHRLGLESQKLSKNNAAKLNEAKVRAMRKFRSNGFSLKELAKKYGVSKATIDLACRGVTWSSVE